MNLLRFLDAYMGFGLVVSPVNTLYADVSSDVSVSITDAEGLESQHDGRLTILGSASGARLMRTFMFGLQLNVGRVRIPLQATNSLNTGNRAAVAGMAVPF